MVETYLSKKRAQMRNMFLQFCTSQNSNLFVRPQMFAFSYRFDQGRVKHEGRTINPEIAPTAELLHAQSLELHASGKAKAQSKSAAVAASCWKLRTPKRTTCSLSTCVQPRLGILKNLHNFIVALASCIVQWSPA